MKTLHALLIAAFAMCAFSLRAAAEDIMTVEYYDSITHATLRFPAGSRLLPKEKDFQQWVALPNGNEVEVLAYKNEKGEHFTWPEIARIESDMPFASLQKQWRVGENAGMDCWRRIYELKDKKGNPYKVVVTEIRGNDNVLVLFEYNTGKMFDSWSHLIVDASSDLPKFTKKLRDAKARWWQWLLVFAIGLSCLAAKPMLGKMGGGGKFLFALLVAGATWAAFYFLTSLPMGIVWVFTCIVGVIWLIYISSDNDEGFFIRIADTIVDNIG